MDLNEAMLKGSLNIIGINTPMFSASDWDFKGEKSALVLDMCCQVGASDYIFGSQGRDYADITSFEKKGINI